METEVERSNSQTLRVFSLLCLGIALALSVPTFFLIVTSRPTFMGMFQEMGSQLPPFTAAVCSPAYALILPALAVASVLKEILLRKPTVKLGLNCVHVCLVLVVAEVYRLGLFLSLADLMQTMSSSR